MNIKEERGSALTKKWNKHVQAFLAGRIWHRQHTPFTSQLIDDHIQSGHITLLSGLSKEQSFFGRTNYQCNRCSNTIQHRFTKFHCLACEGECVYCRQCLKMGRISQCTQLLQWSGPPLAFPLHHQNNWSGTLTPQQQKASTELSESTNKGKSHLLFAVCGAGKTEVLFQPIFEQLQKGKRVCLAAPRVDVILELEPRLRQAFPKTTIAALYGGAENVDPAAQLILATTHQLYRFHQAFDVVFVDEADAFPYDADQTLQQAVQKASKAHAPIHLVTATPQASLIHHYTKQQAISMMYRRYHNHPLPLPTFQTLWNYDKQIQKQTLPKKLLKWTTERIKNEQPFLIFFHDIKRMEQALPLFQQLEESIVAVHASHPNRKEYVQQLREKKRIGLLTTTILERGITIPNVQVAVVGAEQKIFTSGALIQIGGRVGRASDYPTGEFVLFHHGISTAMDDAKRIIRKMNQKGGF